MHALGRTPASPRTAGGSPQGGEGSPHWQQGDEPETRGGGAILLQARVAPAAIRPVGASGPAAGNMLRPRGSSCCTAVNERRPRDRGCGRATRRAGAACGRGGGAGRADTAGAWQPARGKRCHRAGEQGIDWTEPLPLPLDHGLPSWRGGGMRIARPCGEVADARQSASRVTKGIAEPSREVGDARRPARADSGRRLVRVGVTIMERDSSEATPRSRSGLERRIDDELFTTRCTVGSSCGVLRRPGVDDGTAKRRRRACRWRRCHA